MFLGITQLQAYFLYLYLIFSVKCNFSIFWFVGSAVRTVHRLLFWFYLSLINESPWSPTLIRSQEVQVALELGISHLFIYM